jgi:release factor glutamine methyltransferase
LPDTGVVGRLRAAGCVFAEEEAEMLLAAAAGADELDLMVERRAAGLPLEHIVGWAGFGGLRIEVGSGVFVPRRRTEFLVGHAVGLARPGAVCVDLCCGSGAAGAVLLDRVRGAEVHAADIEPAAVRCARRNVEPRGGRVYEGDLFAPLPVELRGRVEILVANVPYVPTEEIGLLPPEARDHEPLVTLDGGRDGLDVLRRVAAGAPEWLAPGGHLFMETSERQAERAVEAVTEVSDGRLAPEVITSEEWWATVVVATRR